MYIPPEGVLAPEAYKQLAGGGRLQGPLCLWLSESRPRLVAAGLSLQCSLSHMPPDPVWSATNHGLLGNFYQVAPDWS